MRLIAIPIARVKPGATPVSTFLAQRTPIKPTFTSHQLQNKGASSSSATTGGAGAGRETEQEKARATEKLPLTKRIMNRASQFWIDLGREDQTSTFDWKRRTYTAGERLMDQIEYEEWALKGVDPALGPQLLPPPPSQGDKQPATSSSTKPSTMAHVPLLFPSAFLDGSSLLASLTQLTRSRQPHHRQRMIWCIIGMPITAPFALVPVIPNLPFFYLVWRAWSHWRAYKSSQYLNDLITQGKLVPQASDELDRLMSLPIPPPSPPVAKDSTEGKATEAGAAPPPPPSSTADAKQTSKLIAPMDADANVEAMMILKPHHIAALSKTFNMDRQLTVDMSRARLQTLKAIKAGKLTKLEAAAAQDTESATSSTKDDEKTHRSP